MPISCAELLIIWFSGGIAGLGHMASEEEIFISPGGPDEIRDLSSGVKREGGNDRTTGIKTKSTSSGKNDKRQIAGRKRGH
jgi:hypothetical protein